MSGADKLVAAVISAGCGALLCAAGCDGGPPTPLALHRLARFTTGVHPNDAAIGDFDGDGDLDVAVPALVSPPIATLWNDGGDLRYQLDAPLDVGATGAAAADLDGDGTDELLLSNREWDSIAVLGASSGRWRELERVTVSDAEHVCPGDLDGDGRMDLAITRFHDDQVQLRLSAGQDGWMRVVDIEVGDGPQPIALVPGSAPRLAIGETGGNSVSFVGASNGEWQVLGRVATPAWPATLEAADVDGDGELEVLGAANLGDSLFVIDDVDSTPAAAVTAAGYGAFGVAAVSDAPHARGASAVVLSNKFDDTLMIFERDSTGAFSLVHEQSSQHGPSPVYAADLTGSDVPEIVVVDAFADSVSIYELR